MTNSSKDFGSQYQTINDILILQKQNQPKKIAYRFLLSDDEEVALNYEELYDQVRSLSHHIQQQTKPFDRVCLSSRPGLDFIVGFYACLLARTIAVPIIPPANVMMTIRFLHVLKDAGSQLILFDKETAKTFNFAQKANSIVPNKLKHFIGIHEVHSELFATFKNEEIKTLIISDYNNTPCNDYDFRECSSEDTAFLQYTSGSTGNPKGVMITHANLLHNMEIIRKVVNHSEDSHVFSWLPPYHDMGLIAGIIEPLYSGITVTLMPTLDFIERPSRWVEGMAKYKCTSTGAPNFAYELCALKTSDELVNKMDLSLLEVAANGAEPLNNAAMELFYKKFESAGLRKGAILPCYGLAESTVMVSGKQFLTDERLLSVDFEQLKKHKIEITEQKNSSKLLVSSGVPALNVKIVNSDSLIECKQNEVGEIWINGSSVARGYYNNEAETTKTFHAQIKEDKNATKYLRTGDLGFMHKGELFVCGRIKNMIIIRGQNYYPQDIEYAVSYANNAIRKGCVVVYAATHDAQETLVVVAEVKATIGKKNLLVISESIKSEISLAFQLSANQIILVPPKSIPKTSSGKLQRIKCQELIENQQIKPLYHYILEELLARTTAQESVIEARHEWIMQFDKANMKERKERLKTLVLSVTAKILSIPELSSIDINKGFFDLGMDSIKAVEIKTQLQEQFNNRIVLDNSLIFNFPTIKALIEHLVNELSPEKPKEKKVALDSTHSSSSDAEDIVIIGMSCNFPGAGSIDDFWQLLVEGREGITEVPGSRWNKEEYYSSNRADPGKMITKRSGFIDQIEYFDSTLFSISPKEIEYLDPQQRLLLMNTWIAFENANLNPVGYRGSNTGVFIGISSHDYEHLIVKNISELKITPYWSTGNAASTATGRLSYYFGFEGPNMAVDTACSSSLVALHEACNALQRSECRLAVVGGVNAILSPDLSIIFSKAGMLAPDGKCKTFDAKADGYVRGEGCGIVLLKKMSDALRDNDTILAVIKASGLNQDGASSGLTVPNGEAQEKLLRMVLAEAKLKPIDIDYLECHGTGTSLGDPIEVNAIGAVYGQERTAEHPLNLGSVKTNIGHLEAASGIAGLIKTVLSLKHHTLPKHLNFSKLNPSITLDFPSEIVTQTHNWADRGRPRRAALSSFGFSGTNAHVILEEAPSQNPKYEMTTLPTVQLFVLAAKTKKSLEEMVQSYINYLEKTPDTIADICYSAAIGRSHLAYRLTIISSEKKELMHQLKAKAFKISEASLVDELVQSNDLNSLANDYLSGKSIDWEYYYTPYINALSKVTLPNYQFDTQRYWLDIKKIKASPYRALVHKLLGAKQPGHSNEIRFLNQLDLNDLDYLKDHCVYGHVLFPGAGFVESALAVGVETLGDAPLCIKDLSLFVPLALERPSEYEVGLVPQTNNSYRGLIYAKQTGALSWIHHADFMVEPILNRVREFIYLAEIKESLTTVDLSTLYPRFNQVGLTYGEAFQSIQEVFIGENKALVAIKNEYIGTEGYYMHPSLLDGVFQSVSLAINVEPSKIYIPSTIARMDWYQKARGLIWAEISVVNYDSHALSANIKITDESGIVLAVIQGFVARTLTKHDLVKLLSEKEELGRYVEDYEVYNLPQAQQENHDILVINGKNNETLTQKHVIFVYEGNFNQLVTTAKQVLTTKPLSFTLVTQHAFSINQEDKINPEHTQALGFWKSFRLEVDDVPCYLIDTEDQNYSTTIIDLLAEKALPEHQIILRDQVYVPRLMSQEAYAKRHHRLQAPGPQMYLTSSGGIDTLYWAERTLRPLADDELKIRITTTALNFRDVLKAMNLYPGDSGDFGYECVGEVLAIGNKIQELKPSDKVIALGQGLFGGEAIVKEVQVALLPQQLSPLQGASIPIVFLTANYALNTLARIKTGQKILIHAASGGVGLAAIAIAKLKGAIVYATASQLKQAYLKESLGLEHVYDSRSTQFKQQILADTHGSGVDVVLNSLVAPGFIEASLGCLSTGGMFLEISKINVYTNEQMNEVRPDVTYHLIGIDKRIKEEPKAIQEELKQILSLFAIRNLRPLPITEYPVTEIIDAFHYMQQARQIGKVVLSYPIPFTYAADATYLISGGTGGLGLELAKHLIKKGVRHLVLLTRSQASASIKNWMQEQKTQGVHITHYAADIANNQELRTVFAAMGNDYPLKGIFHAAGLVKDGLLVNLTKEDFDAVISVKIKGGLNLHEMSLKADLDCFVLFSSVTSLLGNQGQSNYAAANAFMDGFAIQRNQQGLPALSINWGPFAAVGMAASLEPLHRSQGIIPLDAQKAFNAMDSLLISGMGQIAIMTMDWSKTFAQDNSYLTYLVPQKANTQSEWMLMLEAAPPEHRGQVLVDQIKQVLAEMLNISDSNAIDSNKYFFDMGMDSLMLIELKNKIEFNFSKQITLKPADVFEKNNVIKLSEFIFSKINMGQFDLSLTKDLEISAQEITAVEVPATKETMEKATDVTCFEEFIQLEHDLGALEKAGIDNLFFNTVEDVSSDSILIHGKKYINFSGYNYLGLSGNDEINDAVYEAIKKYGTSVSASRLVSGQKPIHAELESAIANLIGTEKSLLFSSGYGTNIGAITTLVGKDDVIFHDELSHNSLIQASIYSGAQRFSYPHNDVLALDELLLKHRKNYRRALVITEGVFSMDGDIALIPELIKLKKLHHMLLMVDEAHSMGVLGKTGRGIREHFQLDATDVDVWMGTLSKSFASCGGYIAGSESLIKLLQYRSQGFIFSAGIPPTSTAASLKAIELMLRNPVKVADLHARSQLLLNRLKEYKVNTGMSHGTPIIPVIVGDSNKALILSNKLRDAYIYAMPIVYPAVAEQAARVRLFVNCLHQEEQINITAETIAHEYNKLMDIER